MVNSFRSFGSVRLAREVVAVASTVVRTLVVIAVAMALASAVTAHSRMYGSDVRESRRTIRLPSIYC